MWITMKITLLRFPTTDDWILCRRAALVTAGRDTEKEPSFAMKCNLLNAEHSPIRMLRFAFHLEGVPYYVSNHLVRHYVGCTPCVRSQRNDRQNVYDRNAARQDAPVDMIWELNAQSLINIAHKRLCGMADPATRRIVTEICDLAKAVCPEFKFFLIPECEYRGGLCHEIRGCGRCPKAERPWEN